MAQSSPFSTLLSVIIPCSRYGSVVQPKTYSTPIVQGNGGTHLFP